MQPNRQHRMVTPVADRAAPRLVVVGASLAGLRAVEAARKAGHVGPITLIGDESHLPYDRPPLSKEFIGPSGSPGLPAFRTPEALRDELAVSLVLGAAAEGVDTAGKVVHVGGQEVAYDALVIATGATARQLPATAGLPGVHVLRRFEDAVAVRSALERGASTVVVGGGFIGSEVASAARKRGLDVSIVEAQPTPLTRAIGAQLGAACSALHVRNGTVLRCGVGVTAIVGGDRAERVNLSDGTSIEADLVVVGIGATPATDWLTGSGIELDDGVVCDAYMRTNIEGVFAAGDVARWSNATFDSHMRVEHWTNAAEQGATAGRNAVSPARMTPYMTVPYFWSDWYSSRIQFVGVPGADDHQVVSGDLDGDHFVALYRTGDRITGALTLNGQRHIMKYRRLIGDRTSFPDAIEFARTLVTPQRSTA